MSIRNSPLPHQSNDTNNSLKPGKKVTVYHIPLLKRAMVEGRATIVSSIPGVANLYRVRFEGGGCQYRFVHTGDCQSDPARFMAMLDAHWRASLDPGLLAEPFPP